MNIFFLDRDGKQCAKYHCDKHVVKMILEHCQLLSTALNLTGNNIPNLYKTTHKNHPSAIWVRSSREHYLWLIEMTQWLMVEYSNRYKKIHKCELDGKIDTFFEHAHLIPENGWVDPPQCMPDECKMEDTVEAYRNYYLMKKSHIFSWKNERVPEWVDHKILTAMLRK